LRYRGTKYDKSNWSKEEKERVGSEVTIETIILNLARNSTSFGPKKKVWNKIFTLRKERFDQAKANLSRDYEGCWSLFMFLSCVDLINYFFINRYEIARLNNVM